MTYEIELLPTDETSEPRVVQISPEQADKMQNDGITQRRDINYTGRTLLRNDCWYGPHNTWGPEYVVRQQGMGKGENPALQWYSRGWVVRKGEKVKGHVITGRANATNWQEMWADLWHVTGPFSETFDSTAEATFTRISRTVVVGGTNDRVWYDDQGIDFEVPENGFIVPAFRGIGVTSNRVFYLDARIELE